MSGRVKLTDGGRAALEVLAAPLVGRWVPMTNRATKAHEVNDAAARRLERQGLAVSCYFDHERFYRITDAGREALLGASGIGEER